MSPHFLSLPRRFRVLLALIALACKTENALDFHTTPSPPPVGETVHPDLSYFNGKTASAGPSSNFALALQTVAQLDTLFRFLDLAGKALDDAATHTVSKPNDAWEWPFDVTHRGVRYTGKLLGGRQGAQNVYRLAISSANDSPPFTNYTLLNGQLDFSSTQGTWLVYDLKSSATTPMNTVEFYRTNSIVQLTIRSDTSSYSYEANQDTHKLYGGVYNTGNSLTMLWLPTSGRGSIAVGNNPPKCWGAQGEDVLC